MAKQDGGRRPIVPAVVARAAVAELSAHGIAVSADWDEEPDVNGDELWHRYSFEFLDGAVGASDIPGIIDIARHAIRRFGYRGLTSVKVYGVIGERGNAIATGERTLTFTRNFDSAFSSVSQRLKQLKMRGSVRNEITGFGIDARAPHWMEADARRRGKLGTQALAKPTRQRYETPTRQKRKRKRK